MKNTVLLLLIVSLSGCKNTQKQSEIMNDNEAIRETITRLFVNTDTGNWNNVEAQFAAEVQLDYSSMTGNPASKVSPVEITTAWKTVLPGFTHTHHQIGNFMIEVNGKKAHTFCYGTATHYLENENNTVWTVVGTYDFDLEKIDGQWKINAMTFNYKYQDGNKNLVDKAIQNVNSN